MPSRRVMDHTRMRFDNMTPIKLWTRMGKVTNPEKLEAFYLVAEERNMPDLAVAAKARLAMLTGEEITSHSPKPKQIGRTIGDRGLRRIDV